ncbi:MAG TPA: Pr2TM family membrane protein [Rhodospirillaceae bacterium]|nr:Pr2TM family membrane protein [Rhodospirillaceae bacterium]
MARLTVRPRSGRNYTLFWFISHLIIYSMVMVAVVAVNMVVAPSRPWFLLILFGWCGLLILQARNVMGSRADDRQIADRP